MLGDVRVVTLEQAGGRTDVRTAVRRLVRIVAAVVALVAVRPERDALEAVLAQKLRAETKWIIFSRAIGIVMAQKLPSEKSPMFRTQ